MTQQIINLGTADKGNGDVLRTAFGKVNANFAELYNQLAASVVVGATAPTGPEEGALWWNSESGRMYVYYGTAWVDASPVDGAGISSTNQLVNGAYTTSLGANGVLTLPDGSIINGSTIRGIAGTGELNYTGITIGPNSNDAEKTWMWVGHENAYISTNNSANTWTFGTDGDLTFPDGTTTTGKSITIPVDQSLTVNTSYSMGPGGATTFKINPESIKLPTGNGVIFSGTEAAENAWWLDSANKTLYFPDAGDGVFPQIKYSTTGNDGMQLLTAAKPIKITVESNTHWTFGTDGSLTLPGAVVKSTAAKTGVILPTTTGPINNFNFSPLDGSGGLVDGTNIGPLTVGTMIFFAGVENGLPFGSYIQTQPILTIGDTIGTIDSGDLGGTPGTTFTLTVTNVVQETPTAIDLTKSVNKLTDGDYTLANGVEGQIVYLVRQTGSTAHTVTVANARIEGVMQTNIPFTPFTDGTSPTNMATLIFTDSAWQNMGGYWNLT